jgi:DUF971 family protein
VTKLRAPSDSRNLCAWKFTDCRAKTEANCRTRQSFQKNFVLAFVQHIDWIQITMSRYLEFATIHFEKRRDTNQRHQRTEPTRMQSPQNIRVHKEQRELELVWTDSDISRLPFRTVRQNCRCAVCVDEFTGKQLLAPESVPVDLGLLEVSLCGNYALRIRWSDNHDSGLFTWNHLRSISDQLAVG